MTTIHIEDNCLIKNNILGFFFKKDAWQPQVSEY